MVPQIEALAARAAGAADQTDWTWSAMLSGSPDVQCLHSGPGVFVIDP
jgi:hypothetical protein